MSFTFTTSKIQQYFAHSAVCIADLWRHWQQNAYDDEILYLCWCSDYVIYNIGLHCMIWLNI